MNCWMGDLLARYRYSGNNFAPHPGPNVFEPLRLRIAADPGRRSTGSWPTSLAIDARHSVGTSVTSRSWGAAGDRVFQPRCDAPVCAGALARSQSTCGDGLASQQPAGDGRRHLTPLRPRCRTRGAQGRAVESDVLLRAGTCDGASPCAQLTAVIGRIRHGAGGHNGLGRRRIQSGEGSKRIELMQSGPAKG